MKTLHLFSFLCSLTILSCTKTNNESINPSYNSNTADYSTLIIGKWQLSETGTTFYRSFENTIQTETTWVKATTNEILEFKNTCEFTKELKDWGNCKGNFKIINNTLVTNVNCQMENNITELTQTTLIFDSQNKLKMRYKYTRLW